MLNIMIARLLNLWLGQKSSFDVDTEDDFKEMEIWSSNIQDPKHVLYNPFLLTN
mgnify:FL=1